MLFQSGFISGSPGPQGFGFAPTLSCFVGLMKMKKVKKTRKTKKTKKTKKMKKLSSDKSEIAKEMKRSDGL